jgi:DNA-directed RNA polymerase subunit omega
MMIEPSISNLLKKVDCRYTLVVATAKRARQLSEGANKLTKCDSEKAVTIATNEISEDKITYVRTKSGIK